MLQRKTLDQLINNDDPGWPVIQEWIGEAKNHVEVLPPKDPDRSEELLALQVTTRSILGAIAYETGGILVNHGWLRILGSGHPRLDRSLSSWNASLGNDISTIPFGYSLIADDAAGGFFAVDAGVLGNHLKVFYYAPDSLSWEDTKTSYPEFIHWCFTGNIDRFYESLRWEGWREDIAEMSGSQAISFAPPLCVKSVVKSQTERSRKPVAVAELFGYLVNFLPEQLKDLEDGQVIQLVVKD